VASLRRKSKDAKVRLLADVGLFSGCSRRELDKIASLVDEVDVPAGKVMTREGDSGWECFVIAEGNAKATRNGRKIASFGPGSFFGEMSLLDQGPRSATVSAETDMHLLVLSSRGFFALVDDMPVVARKVMAVLAERLRAAERAPSH
jgi:CRP/FNR family transcriptional regulator, cyclic AMP receptor protein